MSDQFDHPDTGTTERTDAELLAEAGNGHPRDHVLTIARRDERHVKITCNVCHPGETYVRRYVS